MAKKETREIEYRIRGVDDGSARRAIAGVEKQVRDSARRQELLDMASRRGGGGVGSGGAIPLAGRDTSRIQIQRVVNRSAQEQQLRDTTAGILRGERFKAQQERLRSIARDRADSLLVGRGGARAGELLREASIIPGAGRAARLGGGGFGGGGAIGGRFAGLGSTATNAAFLGAQTGVPGAEPLLSGVVAAALVKDVARDGLRLAGVRNGAIRGIASRFAPAALSAGRAGLQVAGRFAGPAGLALGGAALARNAFDAPDAYFAARATGSGRISSFGQAAASLVFGNPGATLTPGRTGNIQADRDRIRSERLAALQPNIQALRDTRAQLAGGETALRAARDQQLRQIDETISSNQISGLSSVQQQKLSRLVQETRQEVLNAYAKAIDADLRQQSEALIGSIESTGELRSIAGSFDAPGQLRDAAFDEIARRNLADSDASAQRRRAEISRSIQANIETAYANQDASRAALVGGSGRLAGVAEALVARQGLLDQGVDAGLANTLFRQQAGASLIQNLQATPAPANATAAALGPGNIGARTAGLSNNDPTVQIQKNIEQLIKDAIAELKKLSVAGGTGVSFQFP